MTDASSDVHGDKLRPIRRPCDAEHNAAVTLRKLHFTDASATPTGVDAGVDIRGTGIVAQVKCEMTPVGRPTVQQLYGCAQAEGARGVVFSLDGFTAQAKDWANLVGVALFTFDYTGEPDPANDAAVAMTAAVATTPDPAVPLLHRLHGGPGVPPEVYDELRTGTLTNQVWFVLGKTDEHALFRARDLVAVRHRTHPGTVQTTRQNPPLSTNELWHEFAWLVGSETIILPGVANWPNETIAALSDIVKSDSVTVPYGDGLTMPLYLPTPWLLLPWVTPDDGLPAMPDETNTRIIR
jgi:hypothetical protein